MFDHDISPVSFGAEAMFHCISIRFERRPTETQEQALQWLQLLSQMEIVIPIEIMLGMFTKGVTSTLPAFNIIRSETVQETDDVSTPRLDLTSDDAGSQDAASTSTLRPDSTGASTASLLGKASSLL